MYGSVWLATDPTRASLEAAAARDELKDLVIFEGAVGAGATVAMRCRRGRYLALPSFAKIPS